MRNKELKVIIDEDFYQWLESTAKASSVRTPVLAKTILQVFKRTAQGLPQDVLTADEAHLLLNYRARKNGQAKALGGDTVAFDMAGATDAQRYAFRDAELEAIAEKSLPKKTTKKRRAKVFDKSGAELI